MPDEKVEAASSEMADEMEAHVEGLVKMIKEGVVSFVHPTCVAAHEGAGWVLRKYKFV